MSWRVVHVKDSQKMKLKLDNLVIQKGGEEFIIPLSDISVIVAEGGETVVTLRLLSALSKYNIALIVCDTNFLPTGFYMAYHGHFRASKKARKQIAWTETEKDALWRVIIHFKINNQQDLLSTLEKDIKAIQLLANYKEEIEPGDKSNREGHAAKVYFNELFGKNFTRKTQKEGDVINAGLNYGYTILRAQMARIVVGYGLLPLIGIFHKNEYNQFNLVDDLVEPFRQCVDFWVYHHLQEAEYLTYHHRLQLINLLNAKIKYGKEKCSVSTAMDRYVRGFISAIEKGDISKFHCPVVSSLEWSDL
ncbi:type II CRISPR-associated endonuclease Cas1 [Streptococcus pacificus]|uniref:CRISPR-associated endonuclease Cas1 n=1 Tax=Streptococcus pacificus TaxID=2740577 RepID=A0ABS0ZH73_9STRE|nr:type II CRISPR-associated endonuclease Cas1 [Streptococcus pacificus]MBJ8325354.1 type II CRISPR-associated endonuclease Cas1 [Streptococcus pacificus]